MQIKNEVMWKCENEVSKDGKTGSQKVVYY